MILCISLSGWILLKEQHFKNRRIGNFAKCTKRIGHEKYPKYVHYRTQSPKFKFRRFHSMINRFRDISRFRFFHWLPCENFKVPQMLSNILYSTMVSNVLIKVWLTPDENRRRSSVLKFPGPYGHVLTTISKCHKIFNFWQVAKKVIAYIPPWLTHE